MHEYLLMVTYVLPESMRKADLGLHTMASQVLAMYSNVHSGKDVLPADIITVKINPDS